MFLLHDPRRRRRMKGKKVVKVRNEGSVRISPSKILSFRKIWVSEKFTPPHLKLLSMGYFGGDLFLFGGQTKCKETNEIVCSNEMYEFNLEGRKWKRGEQKGDIPCSRCAYSLNCIKEMMYLFGGRDTKTRKKFNDVFVYNMKKKTWKEIICKGEIPAKRDTALSFISNGKIYLYGGHEDLTYTNDLHSLDLSTKTWTEIHLEKKPPLVLGCSVLFSLSKEFHFYGGLHDQHKCVNDFSNDVHRIGLTDYYQQSSTNVDYICEKRRKPSFGQSCIQISKKQSIILGGSTHSYFQSNYDYNDEVYMFTMEKKTIRSKKIGFFPSRCFSSAVQIDKKTWILFGGRRKGKIEGTNDLLEIELLDFDASPFSALLKEEHFYDTELICRNKEIVKVHSIFLMQSSLLLQCFDLYAKESLRKKKKIFPIDLSEFDKSSIMIVMRWLYGEPPESTRDEGWYNGMDERNILELYTIGKRLKLMEFMYYLCSQFEQYLNRRLKWNQFSKNEKQLLRKIIEVGNPLALFFHEKKKGVFVRNKKINLKDVLYHKDFKSFSANLKKKNEKKERIFGVELAEPLELCFKNLEMNRKRNCNFKILSKNDQFIDCHREILISMSDYFSKMLTGEFMESKSAFVKEDVDFRILQLWIDYFYTKRIEENTSLEDIVVLSMLANEKCMFMLQEYCNEIVLNQIEEKSLLKALLFVKPLLEIPSFYSRMRKKLKKLEKKGTLAELILSQSKDIFLDTSGEFKDSE